MNNKGFTLTELLAIIVILSIIVVLAAPAISKEVKKGEEESKSIVNEKIEDAAHLYVAKYYADDIVSSSTGDYKISFSLEDLQKDGLIELKDNVCANVRTGKIIVHYGAEVSYDYREVIDGNNCYKQKTN